MLFWTIYRYELKKIFSHRIKLLILLAIAAFLFIVSAQRYFSDSSEQQSWKTEQSLDIISDRIVIIFAMWIAFGYRNC